MRIRPILAAGLLSAIGAGALAQSSAPWAGRYYGPFDGGKGEVTITGPLGNGSNYKIDVLVGGSANGCGGSISGVGTARGNRLTLEVPTDNGLCTVTLTRTAGGLGVSESGCSYMHGASCGFSGAVRPAGPVAAPIKSAGPAWIATAGGESYVADANGLGLVLEVGCGVEDGEPFVALGIPNGAGSIETSGQMAGSSLDERYATYRDKTLPEFMSAYERKIERLYNQIPFTIRIANVGHVRADKFVAEVESSEGWLHHKFVFVPPMGPPAPRARSRLADLTPHFNPFHIPEKVSRHEIEFVEGRDRTPFIVVNCEDFRHGQEWVFSGIFALDVRNDAPASISARVTASNLHGAAEMTATVTKKMEAVSVFDLIDRESLRLQRDLLMQEAVDQAIQSDDSYRAIEFDTADDD